MIKFGLTLQEKPNELPAEVAVWLLERDGRYPDIEFKVDYWDMRDEDVEGHEKRWQRFSRLIQLRDSGVPLAVIFMYPRQSWDVRIIGNLTAKERVEITQMPKVNEYEIVSERVIGIPLKSNETPNELPEFIPVEPHMYMTGLIMSGAEVLDVAYGPRTDRKDAIMKAMSEKDWDKAKELLRKRH